MTRPPTSPFLLLLLPAALWFCTDGLPQADSPGARQYVRFCDREQCHTAFYPQRGGTRYWQQQTDRMLELMRQQRLALPNTEEERLIRDYLGRNAYRKK
jgi:hypothetical protein